MISVFKNLNFVYACAIRSLVLKPVKYESTRHPTDVCFMRIEVESMRTEVKSRQ